MLSSKADSYTPKARMLNAYRGFFSDRYPVAPEFWCYVPAKVLGVTMVQLQREIPFWKALQATFKRYGTEGWGSVACDTTHPDAAVSEQFEKISNRQYRLTTKKTLNRKTLTDVHLYDVADPCWCVEHPVKNEDDLAAFVELNCAAKNVFDFTGANQAYHGVGEDFLLEFSLGPTFFDFIAYNMGFEEAAVYFMSGNDVALEKYQQRYIESQREMLRQACAKTPYESFFIGCGYACNSLISPAMWRQWGKPYIQAMAAEAHKHDRLLHVHFHGKTMETVADFAEIGIDCVCPFERPPGGDVAGLEGLRTVRQMLDNKVTMNGNMHTVETLIQGNPAKAKMEVAEIAEAFRGSARLIFGTGDQVGRETKEENLAAYIETAKSIVSQK